MSWFTINAIRYRIPIKNKVKHCFKRCLLKKIIWATATPIHDILVLTFTSLFSVPVSQVKVVVDVTFTKSEMRDNL